MEIGLNKSIFCMLQDDYKSMYIIHLYTIYSCSVQFWSMGVTLSGAGSGWTLKTFRDRQNDGVHRSPRDSIVLGMPITQTLLHSVCPLHHWPVHLPGLIPSSSSTLFNLQNIYIYSFTYIYVDIIYTCTVCDLIRSKLWVKIQSNRTVSQTSALWIKTFKIRVICCPGMRIYFCSYI